MILSEEERKTESKPDNQKALHMGLQLQTREVPAMPLWGGERLGPPEAWGCRAGLREGASAGSGSHPPRHRTKPTT